MTGRPPNFYKCYKLLTDLKAPLMGANVQKLTDMNPTINLFRKSDDRIQTLGQIECEELLLHSMELPWLDNQVGISCIPPGEYEIVKHVSPKFGPCYWVQDVQGRSEILIHPANFVRQLRGCIAPGLSLADIDGDGNLDVTSSKIAMGKLLDKDATKLIVWGV